MMWPAEKKLGLNQLDDELSLKMAVQVGLVVSMSASHTVGRGFVSRSVIPKTIIKIIRTASLHRHAIRYGWSLAVQPDCLKGRVVGGTVYMDMHLKYLLGSIVRVGYHIPARISI